MSEGMISSTEAARRYGLRTRRITDLCLRGTFKRARKVVQEGQTRTRWYCDPEELARYFALHPPVPSRPATGQPRAPRQPGEHGADGLTAAQCKTIAREEDYLDLVALERLAKPQGAVRVSWDNGESFTVTPDGETWNYTYVSE